MGALEDLQRALRQSLSELAAADAAELVESARKAARERAKALIEEALVEEILAAAARSRSPQPAAEQRPQPRSEGDAWWAYCILAERDAPAAAGEVPGIEPGTRVEVVSEGGLAALVSRVPLAEYDDERLREHLEDLEWVQRTAYGHEAVMDRALEQATILPLRLCTLFADQEGITRMLRERAASLKDDLASVEGCTEWGVKLFATQVAGEQAPGSAPSGAEYLAERQRQRARAKSEAEEHVRRAEELHEQLAAITRAATANPLQRPEVHGHDAEMLLNGAYLVEREHAQHVRELIDSRRAELEPAGYVLELTGPWPPYNFISSSAEVVA